MNAEERTEMAITATRHILKKALDSPFTMAVMTYECVQPGDVEDKVYSILEYLEKTAAKKTKSSWDEGLTKMEPEASQYPDKPDEAEA